MIWFADASALVKRYVNEVGSYWLRRELAHHQIFMAEITSVEIVAALGRRFRQGDISQFALYQARKRFLTHRAKQQYQIIKMNTPIIDEAMRVAVVHDLRAYDAVQLATALVTAKGVERNRFFFVSADAQLEAASAAEGLQIENSLNH